MILVSEQTRLTINSCVINNGGHNNNHLFRENYSKSKQCNEVLVNDPSIISAEN